MTAQDPDGTAPDRAVATRAARLITEVTAPAVTVTIVLPLVGWHAAGGGTVGLAWGALATVFAAGVPMAYIVRGVRRGRITDHHVGVRQQRRVPLLVGLVSVLVGYAAMALLGAPRDLLALLAAGGVGLVVSVLVSRWWKMSLHAAVTSGSVVILALVFGPALLLLGPLLVPVGWSRVRLSDHSVAQVVGGALIGAAVAGGVFALVR